MKASTDHTDRSLQSVDSMEMKSGSLTRGSTLASVRFGRVIIRVVTGIIIVLRLELHIIKHHTKDVCAHIQQLLLRSSYHRARTSAAMNDQHHAVDHRRQNGRISERNCRRRVDDDVCEPFTQKTEQPAHLF